MITLFRRIFGQGWNQPGSKGNAPRFFKRTKPAIVGACFLSGIAAADDVDYTKMELDKLVNVNIYAASVLSAHIHKAGEIMFGFESMYMENAGLRQGNSNVSDLAVLADPRWQAVPTSMSMNMHMGHAMYAPTDNLTLMVMLPYMEMNMGHLAKPMMMGGMDNSKFSTRSEGLGDMEFKGNYIFHRSEQDWGSHEFFVTLGFSAPTGSINKRAYHAAFEQNMRLSYPMQLGSGTFDPIVGLAYQGVLDDYYWGGQWTAKFRGGDNANGYHLGDDYRMAVWLNRAWSDYFSTYIRADGRARGNISGADPKISGQMMTPMDDPSLQGRSMASLTIGAELYAPGGRFSGNRLRAEIGKPVYQNLTGPQLETDWVVSAGWQYKF